MQKKRRTQAERSAETKEKILQATIDLLFEQGNARLTTALVDERAGVSSGARVHHYPAKIDLVVAATGHTYELAAQLGRQRALSARNSPEPLREYVKDCLSIYFDWPFIAALEVVITARTDEVLMERLRPVLENFHGAMKATWIETFVATGYTPSEAEEELALTLNLIRGMAVNKIWKSGDAAYAPLLDAWCADRAARRKTAAALKG
ncbi:TetR/AcrR family transcriptional regulator [Agrobacterium leguminum]|jgi:AcrR family transcriptional regulator|uniref:TetR/AcrR family transcriptional regulator n=1 Tax=Agrobacterium leguminum TaxID=2792015 RepID=A0A9X3KKZ1_9HYPH|nr:MULTISPECIES: TetR/AcrR family transcriptional regulator [Agrobacterium]MBG0511647.1 TetR/AcrR family transcriptional regulator [Agrobacterium leguminum]MCZ7912617.1 TetR/AcrR family transcriptional regulator [Agrobacterium leguminum]WLD98562.1 TetR/AcrR family transcriptional regulator [Agrobacterium leguminum]